MCDIIFALSLNYTIEEYENSCHHLIRVVRRVNDNSPRENYFILSGELGEDRHGLFAWTTPIGVN